MYQGERPGSCSDEENQSKNGSGASQLGSAKGKGEDRLQRVVNVNQTNHQTAIVVTQAELGIIRERIESRV